MRAVLTSSPWTRSEAVAALRDARRRTLELVADLDDDELVVPRAPTHSPFLWELGHVAWSHERWLLRRHGDRPVRAEAEELYDDRVAHAARFELPLLSRKDTLHYLDDVAARVSARLDRGDLDDDERYYLQLAIFHEDSCGERLFALRQVLGLAEPKLSLAITDAPGGGACPGDAAIAGGPMLLGAEPERRFVLDDEKWAHTVDVRPFQIARAPVTQAEFAEFVAEGGYTRGEFWSDSGWRWRQQANAVQPLHWHRDDGGGWLRAHFDQRVELEPDRPVVHVNAHEAEAYCRFADRALPTEAEWEFAAGWLMRIKRPWPWGWHGFEPGYANLDGVRTSTVDVGAFAAGDSLHGCRQMLGNVWEWTASTLRPYPGYEREPDSERSFPRFGKVRVLRGGSFATRARDLRVTRRGFADPERRDLFASFRTVVP
ncbi:MAG: SUMF1/EgtB/PvdO family nonheme iron enzyme [Planctomycetes bacterium]|nr:SUMF1/EgtB/PvdO family nonheme iron enzyme [Planctomycetota bacterium]